MNTVFLDTVGLVAVSDGFTNDKHFKAAGFNLLF